MIARPLSIFAAIALCAGIGHGDPLDGFDEYVTQGMEIWGVPGLAVAIVKDNDVVFAKGYGVRNIETGEAVDPDTLFAIGSCSKAFTAAALAVLVDEGKLNWDDRVIERLPQFRLYDAYATREFTVRDLLCHRSGLARGDLLWYGNTFDRDEIIVRVRYLEPSWSFRSQYGYQNIMFLVAGELVPAIAGNTWDEFIESRFFDPLAMERSNTTITAFSDENVAKPHEEIDGTITPVPYRNLDNIAPAGSINSSVRDMTAWLRLHLNRGAASSRLISETQIDEMHRPQSASRLSGPRAEPIKDVVHFSLYGLGWGLMDFRGRYISTHGGGIDGMTTRVSLMPEERLGLVILTNRGGSLLPEALAYDILDRYLGTRDRDWLALHWEVVQSFEKEAEETRAEREANRVDDTKPSRALDQYAGIYEHRMYGQTEVVLDDGKLVLSRGDSFEGDLQHWHYDTFHVEWSNAALGETFVTFHLDAGGAAESLELEDFATFIKSKAEED